MMTTRRPERTGQCASCFVSRALRLTSDSDRLVVASTASRPGDRRHLRGFLPQSRRDARAERATRHTGTYRLRTESSCQVAGCTRGRPESVTKDSFALSRKRVYLFLAGAASSCYRTWIPALWGHRRVRQFWSDVKRMTQWREKGTLKRKTNAQPMSRAPPVRAPDALFMVQRA